MGLHPLFPPSHVLKVRLMGMKLVDGMKYYMGDIGFS